MEISNKEFCKAEKFGKKMAKKIHKAAQEGELRAFIKHPITEEPIRVHPDLIKRMNEGEQISLEEVLNKKFD